MIQEQVYDVATWWKDQIFPCKEFFSIDEDGALSVRTNFIKERTIATVSIETADVILKNLQDKFTGLEMKVHELETEWAAAEDKLKLVEKVVNVKSAILHANAIGDFDKLITLVNDWEQTLGNLIDINYQAKVKLAEQAELLKDSTEWKETTLVFKDMADRWKQTGYIDKKRNDALYNRIEAAKKAFYDRKKVHFDEEEIEMMENLDLKIELADKAEALANSEEWKITTEKFHNLLDQWKAIGKTKHKKNEELWQRFITAKNVFFDRKSKHFEQIKQEQEASYIVKLALVEKAEALKDSTDWNATSIAYAAIMEEWKKSGRLQADKADELWKRLSEAQDHFFAAKKIVTDAQKIEFENNYRLKAELVERAESLKNSTQWGQATTEMNQLFDEWKKVGQTARNKDNKLWETFIEARKHFFARKDANREERKQFAETMEVQRTQQAEAQKAQRIAQEKQMRKDTIDKIKEEEERLADFTNGIENITPGKKSEQLRQHLQNLIQETKENLKRLRKKAGSDAAEVNEG